MTGTTGLSESRYSFYQTTRRHIPEDSDARHTHTHTHTHIRFSQFRGKGYLMNLKVKKMKYIYHMLMAKCKLRRTSLEF